MAPSVALWCVRPRKRLAAALGRVVHAAPARRECVVYPDGNSDAVAALSAFLAPDPQLTAPDVQVLPADASPALEAALWAASAPRGNRDLQRGRQKVRSRSSRPQQILANAQVEHAPPATIVIVCDAPGADVDATSEPAPPTPPKEREKRDSLLCDGDTVDAVLGSVFD